ncbi:uncharacterized protein LOC123530210 isoform X2 [Mercenaria mercenaria]|uniref:uncharacterized protein LOC123530210 isoform X2 n=1 Tax=Mercenaria mercenaria TaxID=6596 RepID=UPI00234EBD05|nr:uncharacterized protein LOC123530210 isoform X2 [Mercenaria mercenaria]
MSSHNFWIYVVSLLLHCFSADGDVDQCPGLTLSINPDADVKFSVIITIRQPVEEKCGSKISPSAIQNIAAMKWVVDRMNANNFTEGVKIGFDVFDDCGIPRNTMARALDILDGPILGTEECKNSRTTTCNIGIIGASNSITTEAMLYALRGSQLPVIGPFATYYNLTRYSNYYRTVPTDLQQIQATAKVLHQLGLTYVAVVHTDDDYGRYSAMKLKEISKASGVCVDSIQAITEGRRINQSMLKQQRKKTKHNSLRVVYFGRRDIYHSMQIELSYSQSEMFNISWIVVEHPEDVSTPFDSASGLENGTYIISPLVNNVQVVNEYLADKWSKAKQPTDDLERLINCSGEREVPNVFHKDIASTIDSVFVFASALQRKTKLYCTSSICDVLRENFKLNDVQRYPVTYKDINVNITVEEFSDGDRQTNFNNNGDFLPNEEMSLYDIIFVASQNNYTKIGDFRNNSVSLRSSHRNSLDTMPSSICNTECEICENKPDISFAFLDGDTFILGVFAVHETDPNDPFKCSNFRTSQMDVVIIESFLYSVQQMRNDTGIKFGAIAIDDCYSSAQTELVLSQILSGEVTLTNPYTGSRIEVERIAAAVMTVSSSVTIPVGLLMTEKKIPVISASASSPDLDDRINFPYFLRTVPSDVEQARAMISIIKRMGWSYVSLLYVENNYGSKGKEVFVRLANESGICIADPPEGISDVNDDNSDSELISVFSRMINQRADIVVYFGTESRIAHFLKVMNSRNERDEFIFLASEDWGDRQYILNIGQRRTLGSVTLKNEVESLADGPLANHIRSLSPDSISSYRNPWFVEYWEENFECDLPLSFRHKYNKICDNTVKFSNDDITDFVEDHRIVHTVVAVQALAHGLKMSQEEFCNPNLPQGNTFPCQKYFQYIPDVVKYIREVEIPRAGSNVRVFRDDGNGNIGFKINNVQEESENNLEYKTVGSYEGQLTLQVDKMKFYQNIDGACFSTLCGHCTNSSFTRPVTIATTTHMHPETEEFSVPDYTIIGILGFLFVVIMVMSIIIICYFKRRIVELERQLKETKYEIRTGYALHNGSAFSHANTTSLTYPDLKFANTSPSGDTMYEWRKAQNVLNGGNSKYSQSNGGVINQGFVGSEMYLHATHDDDENLQSSSSGNYNASPRGHVSNSDQLNSVSDSPTYRPPSSSYGLTSHSSFKKPADYNHNGQIKKQPRTQLAVPPCRPELPPRDPEQQRAHAQRPNGFTDKFDHLSSAVPKEKVRKVRSSPRRTVSPPSFKHNPSTGENSRYRDTNIADSSKYNGSPANMTFSDSKMASPDMANLAGSIEKISRV